MASPVTSVAKAGYFRGTGVPRFKARVDLAAEGANGASRAELALAIMYMEGRHTFRGSKTDWNGWRKYAARVMVGGVQLGFLISAW